MNYSVRRMLIGKNDHLDSLTRESGKLYSRTITFFWRTARKKNIWLKPKHLMRIFNSDKIHAHSADASIQAFFNALSSWRQHRKSDPNCRPPKKRRFFYPITWKSSAIKLKDGNLVLSNGKLTQPVIINNWKHDLPKIALMRYTGKQYEIIFTYSKEPQELQIEEEKPVGVDLGQIHIATCSNGLILNGRKLRSLRQWKDKKLADYQEMLSTKKKGSRKWKTLVKQKKRFLRKVNNQSNDILHKFTTGLVLTQKALGVNTLVVGDLKGYRQDNDCGKTRNQENHQWTYGKVTFMLSYKCEKFGMQMKLQEESYTSKTCPSCGHQKKMKGRDFVCRECSFVAHRDVVGSWNILQKYLGKFGVSQVVPEMAPGFGVRYNSNINVACGFKSFLNMQESTPF